jgi:hypothetical protein
VQQRPQQIVKTVSVLRVLHARRHNPPLHGRAISRREKSTPIDIGMERLAAWQA